MPGVWMCAPYHMYFRSKPRMPHNTPVYRYFVRWVEFDCAFKKCDWYFIRYTSLFCTPNNHHFLLAPSELAASSAVTSVSWRYTSFWDVSRACRRCLTNFGYINTNAYWCFCPNLKPPWPVVCVPKDEDGGKHIVHQNNRLQAPAVSTRSKTAK